MFQLTIQILDGKQKCVCPCCTCLWTTEEGVSRKRKVLILAGKAESFAEVKQALIHRDGSESLLYWHNHVIDYMHDRMETGHN